VSFCDICCVSYEHICPHIHTQAVFKKPAIVPSLALAEEGSSLPQLLFQDTRMAKNAAPPSPSPTPLVDETHPHLVLRVVKSCHVCVALARGVGVGGGGGADSLICL
jgi:hypothetical protein